MRKLLLLFITGLLMYGCVTGDGDLVGVQNRENWFEAQPYGMAFIKMGSYNMGPNDLDVPWAMTSESKTVSIAPFWMDITEITNNEYRQFVYWVKDSIAYKILIDNGQEDLYAITEDYWGEEIDPPVINWAEQIDWEGEEEREALQEMFYPENERFYNRKQIDTRKLNYEYFWIDLDQAASKHDFDGQNRRAFNWDKMYDEKKMEYNGEVTDFSRGATMGQKVEIKDRSAYIMRDVVNVYPDTLCWVSDFTYSFNDPMTEMYFWHPAFDNYPVVGVSWKQAVGFSVWRTLLKNNFFASIGETSVQHYRLPTESEWEYASRGNLKESMYPWGGYYTRNYKGCFITNFKPMRGNYVADGGIYPVIVAVNDPNEYGLYDMAGNVAEWTSNAFDEAAYSWSDDLNPDYHYNVLPGDMPEKKRKVIRGGSWKDIAFYLQCGTRTYEYQDSSKSYIGFRNVREYLGRDFDDAGTGSQVY